MKDSSAAPGIGHGEPAAPGGYRTYRPRMPWAWWTGNRRYAVYMLREASSIFIAVWSVLFLAQLSRLRSGRESYDRFVRAQRAPGWLLFHLISFLFALLHAVTFLQLAGTVQTVRLGSRKLTARQVTAGAFAGWAVATLTVLIVVIFGGGRRPD